MISQTIHAFLPPSSSLTQLKLRIEVKARLNTFRLQNRVLMHPFTLCADFKQGFYGRFQIKYVLFEIKPAYFYLKITERAPTTQVSWVDFRSILNEK